MGHAIFFNGAIGAGKTTLGRAAAARLGAAFLDGDDFSDPARPWYASSLSTSRGIADAALSALARTGSVVVVVAYPLRCSNYVYFRRRLTDAGHAAIFVTLRASLAATLSAGRGRSFSGEERRRIAEMIAEGYDARPFSDIVADTDAAGFDETVETIVRRLRPRLAGG
jgi:hypothetical protein